MLTLIFVSFVLSVLIIGVVTAKLNAKRPCDHNWVETDNQSIKCTLCNRVIRHAADTMNAEAEIQLINDKPRRPEGIKIASHLVRDAE